MSKHLNHQGGPRGNERKRAFHGLYIHVPFCARKCNYCDFYSIADPSWVDRFVSALCMEIKGHGRYPHGVDTLYFGGGTPSLLSVRAFDTILSAVHDAFSLASRAEITVEVNPGTVDGAWLDALYALGVNRLNVGVQSFQDTKLRFLGRIHTAAGATSVLEQARRAGFDNLGLDLMYGLPHETPAGWQRDFATALAFSPAHLSCYMLTYEPGTPLDRQRRQGTVVPLAEAAVARMFRTIGRQAVKAGYDHYEVSNFARGRAFRSRHNEKYWTLVPYIGAGPGAHSFDGRKRWWNPAHVQGYVHALEAGQTLTVEQESLTREQLMMERLLLGLRTFDGVDIAAFEALSGFAFGRQFSRTIHRVGRRSWGGIANGRFALNLAGMVYLDAVVGWFVDEMGE